LRTTYTYKSKNIALDVFAPNKQGRYPVVFALHGSGGLHNVGHLEFAQMLANQGFLVCVPHYFDATGTIWADEATIWREFPVWVEVISLAIDAASQHPSADVSRIALVGFSLGAYLALSIASEQPRIKAVVDFFGGIPAHFAEKLKAIAPVLILHGEADFTVPVSEAHKLKSLLERLGSPYDMKLYKGAGHGFRGFDMMDAGKRTYDFLNRNLRGTRETSGTKSPGAA
jgi:carboxymethylenebutenolidase